MEEYEKVYKVLDDMGVSYEAVEHPAAMTAEDADSYIKGIECVRTKTLFLSNKKNSEFYLIIMMDDKMLDIKKLSETLGEKRIHFASEENLYNKLKLQTGMVSLFGIINNTERDVNIYIDEDIQGDEKITFHPNDNTKSVFISIKDMFWFIENLNFKFNVIKF